MRGEAADAQRAAVARAGMTGDAPTPKVVGSALRTPARGAAADRPFLDAAASTASDYPRPAATT